MNKLDEIIKKLLDQLESQEIDVSDFIIRLLKTKEALFPSFIERLSSMLFERIAKDFGKFIEEQHPTAKELKERISSEEVPYLSLATTKYISQNFLGGLHSEGSCNGRLNLIINRDKLYFVCTDCNTKWLYGVLKKVDALGDC